MGKDTPGDGTLTGEGERAAKLKSAWQEMHANVRDWPIVVMRFAEQLFAAREAFRNAATGKVNDRAFGEWLDEHKLTFGDMSKDDRAAYINLGEHPTHARDVLDKTERRSVRLIWEEELHPLLVRKGIIKKPSPKPEAKAPTGDADDGGDTASEAEVEPDDLDIFDHAFSQYDPISALFMFGHMASTTATWEQFKAELANLDEHRRKALASVNAFEALTDMAELLAPPEEDEAEAA